MARRTNRKSGDDLFLALLQSLPWWVPFLLAALVYAVVSRFTLIGAVLWTCILVFAGLVMPYVKLRNKELIESAADLPAIRRMSWQSFERLVGEAFRRQGYVVVESDGPGPDGGVDLILIKRSEKVIVQCKHWQTKPVGVAPVRELRGVVAREKAKRGIFVTSSSYTKEAIAEAEGQPLELIDGVKLCDLLREVRRQSGETQSEAWGQQSTVKEGEPDVATETLDADTPLCPVCSRPMWKRIAKSGPNAGSEFWGCSTFSRTRCRGIRQVQGVGSGS